MSGLCPSMCSHIVLIEINCEKSIFTGLNGKSGPVGDQGEPVLQNVLNLEPDLINVHKNEQ